MHRNIRKLLSPKSVAIVGASPREGVTAMRVPRNLRSEGFTGAVYLVNPKYSEIGGEPCYPSLSALPQVPDAVFVGIAAEHSVAVIEEAGRCGIGAVIINASGFADSGPDGEVLQHALVEAARKADVAICGPNNMGYVNVLDRVCMYTAKNPPKLDAGPVAIISQSGSVAIALSQDARDLGISHIITAGNEAVCTASDYLHAVIEDDRVQVVMMFLETVRDPAGFARAAMEAQRRNKPIVVLKVGRSAGAQAAVAAHTGSLSGEDKVYDAFFRQCGVIRVNDIDELLEAAVLLSKYPQAPSHQGIIAVTVSGGEAALINDVGEDFGLNFPELAASTLAGMSSAFPHFSRPRNPVDAWGLGWDRARFKQIFQSLVTDPSAAAILLAVDAPGSGGADAHVAMDMAEIAVETAGTHHKKIVFLNNSAHDGVNEDVRAVLNPAGIPYLLGMRPAFAAVSRWISKGEAQPLADARETAFPQPAMLSEAARMEAVENASNIAFIKNVVVSNPEEAAVAASRMGFPVVMKGLSELLPHKTEFGLVRLSLGDRNAVEAACRDIQQTLALHAAADPNAQVVVQQMADDGVQLLLGARHDSQFGSILVVGLGGTLVETMKQTSLRLGPVSADVARQMLLETPAGVLIAGTRGKGPYDMDAAVEAIVNFSAFAHGTSHLFSAVEINPLIVRPKGKGVLALDLVLEGRA